MLRRIQYTIVDWLHAYAIQHDKPKLEEQMWFLKWQQTLKWNGEQDWCDANDDEKLRKSAQNLAAYYGKKIPLYSRKEIFLCKIFT